MPYDFIIKPEGKEPITETIYKEIKRIQGDYQLVKGVYLNTPDLTGYQERYTRYLEENEQGFMTPKDWINSESSENWYDYKNSKWANICVESNGAQIDYVWIPRYCFKLDQEEQRSDVKFIDVYNNYIDEEGNKTTWQQLKEQGYQVPEAFEFNETRIPGYWAMKYTVGDTAKPSILSYDMSVSYGIMKIRNITQNTTITNDDPITKYTIALNGEIIRTIEDNETLQNINKEVIELNNLVDGENVINVTGLNANGEIVGSMTKVNEKVEVNEPDLNGFNQETTFYVTYDKDGKESSTIPIINEAPEDWYEYGESRWANIVTRNNGLETYYVWIPRYEFTLDHVNERSNVKFIKGTQGTPKEPVTQGYQIPEAFEFNGQQLSGYWAMKYTAGDEIELTIDIETMATSTSIETRGLTGTLLGKDLDCNEVEQIYKYYINGELKNETTKAEENFEFTGLQSNTKYSLLVEIRNMQTDEYISSIAESISTTDANKPELGVYDNETQSYLEAFKESNTYYVLYDDEGNETIGDRIKRDGSNMPNNWYDYSNRKWANIVVTDGEVVDGKITNETMSTYFVWIPRYQFTITRAQQKQPEKGRTKVNFIQGTSTESYSGYQIPEAFTFNGKELSGYWAMKYTVGTSGVNISILQSNKNTHYVTPANVWDLMNNIRKMETTGGAMGLEETLNADLTASSESNNLDLHMIRTTEYGAIALLSASVYGNPSNEQLITSTTGNNTGLIINAIFDNSGSSAINWEWTAGGLEGYVFSGISEKYFDKYTNNQISAKKGDALSSNKLGCAGWHSAIYSNWVPGRGSYFARGAGGIFSYSAGNPNDTFFSRGIVVLRK